MTTILYHYMSASRHSTVTWIKMEYLQIFGNESSSNEDYDLCLFDLMDYSIGFVYLFLCIATLLGLSIFFFQKSTKKEQVIGKRRSHSDPLVGGSGGSGERPPPTPSMPILPSVSNFSPVQSMSSHSEFSQQTLSSSSRDQRKRPSTSNSQPSSASTDPPTSLHYRQPLQSIGVISTISSTPESSVAGIGIANPSVEPGSRISREGFNPPPAAAIVRARTSTEDSVRIEDSILDPKESIYNFDAKESIPTIYDDEPQPIAVDPPNSWWSRSKRSSSGSSQYNKRTSKTSLLKKKLAQPTEQLQVISSFPLSSF